MNWYSKKCNRNILNKKWARPTFIHFEKIDINKAKNLLGDVVCIRGSVPIHLMWIDNVDKVKEYCKKLIDVCGEGGGFLMDISTASEDIKPENMKALIDFTKEYGVYK